MPTKLDVLHCIGTEPTLLWDDNAVSMSNFEKAPVKAELLLKWSCVNNCIILCVCVCECACVSFSALATLMFVCPFLHTSGLHRTMQLPRLCAVGLWSTPTSVSLTGKAGMLLSFPHARAGPDDRGLGGISRRYVRRTRSLLSSVGVGVGVGAHREGNVPLCKAAAQRRGMQGTPAPCPKMHTNSAAGPWMTNRR